MVSQDNNSMWLRPRAISIFKALLPFKKKSHCNSQQHYGINITNWYFGWTSRLWVTGELGAENLEVDCLPQEGSTPASLSSAWRKVRLEVGPYQKHMSQLSHHVKHL